MMENVTTIDNETLSVFIPMQIKKRGGAAQIILPQNVPHGQSERVYDEKLISAFAKAYHWHLLLKKGKFSNLTEICKKERVGLTYASRLYRLNFVAPQIVDAVLNGTQPRTLCLQDFMEKPLPDVWKEQLKVCGFAV